MTYTRQGFFGLVAGVAGAAFLPSWLRMGRAAPNPPPSRQPGFLYISSIYMVNDHPAEVFQILRAGDSTYYPLLSVPLNRGSVFFWQAMPDEEIACTGFEGFGSDEAAGPFPVLWDPLPTDLRITYTEGSTGAVMCTMWREGVATTMALEG